jgi:hypothetical protein
MTEAYASKVGTSVGVGGVAASRLFHVTVDSNADDPIAYVRSQIPLGSFHPDPSVPSVARRYVIIDRTPNMRIYRVLVEYGPQSSAQILGWRRQFEAAAEMEQLTYTVELNPSARKIIGYPAYEVGGLLPGGPADATTIGIDGTTIPLVRHPRARISRPHQRLKRAGTLTLHRRFGSLALDGIIPPVMALRGYVNGDEFLGAAPKKIMFQGFSLSEEEGYIEGVPLDHPGLIYVVTLSFGWNDDGWTPLRIPHEFLDDQGHSYPVFNNNGDQLHDDNKVALEADFYFLLEFFG